MTQRHTKGWQSKRAPVKGESTRSILDFTVMNRLSQRMLSLTVSSSYELHNNQHQPQIKKPKQPFRNQHQPQYQVDRRFLCIVDRLPSERKFGEKRSTEMTSISSFVSTPADTMIDQPCLPVVSVDDSNEEEQQKKIKLCDRPLICVAPGCHIPLRGSKETLHACTLGNVTVTSCAVCETTFACINSATMVLCPRCKSISEVDQNERNRIISEKEVEPSLGLGLMLDDIIRPRSSSF
jgi:hypothetical protein